jgi:hypothetical protein
VSELIKSPSNSLIYLKDVLKTAPAERFLINPTESSNFISRRIVSGLILLLLAISLLVKTLLVLDKKRRMIFTRAGELNIFPRISMPYIINLFHQKTSKKPLCVPVGAFCVKNL